jgi:translation initiation factor IF-2
MINNNQKQDNSTLRPPVVVVMGHVDHGKSKLLDYIRKTNVVDKEAGGITQSLGAYEVRRVGKDGMERRITFLDTPGHEAFAGMRARGAEVADVAILVVSAEEGVKAQTLEALSCIKKAGIPFVVAINKIDKPGANVAMTKQSLAEHEIYLEDYGGSIPAVPISAMVGTHVDDLLDMVLLVAELQELKGDPKKPATGVVIESHVDHRKGITATLLIKDGTLRKGNFVAAGGAFSPVRTIHNFMDKPVTEATFSSPVRIFGWNQLPAIGEKFISYTSKKEAETAAANFETINRTNQTGSKESKKTNEDEKNNDAKPTLALIIKADTAGGTEAISHEISKIKNDAVNIKIVRKGVGGISEGDIKLALSTNARVLGFNVDLKKDIENMAIRNNVRIEIFNIIYELSDWLIKEVTNLTPKVVVMEQTGKAKILRVWNALKNGQIAGGQVLSGTLKRGGMVKIIRRDKLIGEGKIKNLEQEKIKTDKVEKGREFGILIESKTILAPGDLLEQYENTEK